MLKKSFNFLIISIICIVPLIITPWRIDYYYLPKAKIIYVLSSFLLLLLLLSVKNWKKKMRVQDIFIFMYLVLIIFSSLLSVDFQRSLYGRTLRYEGLLSLASYIVIFIAASKFYTFLNRHVYVLIISVTLISLYALAQYFGFDPIPVDSIRGEWIRYAYSTVGNPNFLGGLLTIVLPLIAALFLLTNKKLYFLTSCLFFLTLLCTRTRGAWIGTSLAFIILLSYVIGKRLNIKPFLFLLASFAAITILLNLYNNFETKTRFVSIINDAKTVAEKAPEYQRAGSTRIFIWEKSLELLRTKPLTGYGPDTFDIPFTDNFREDSERYFGNTVVDKAHNEYLQIAVTTGIPSLLCYLLFLGTIFVKALKSLKTNPKVIILLAGITGYWVQAFFNISVVSVAPVYWAMMGILVSQCDESDTKDIETSVTVGGLL